MDKNDVKSERYTETFNCQSWDVNAGGASCRNEKLPHFSEILKYVPSFKKAQGGLPPTLCLLTPFLPDDIQTSREVP